MKKKKTWMKFRHRVVRNALYPVLYLYSRLRYGITIEKLPKAQQRQCVILYNHQTVFDQFFIGFAMGGPIYYMATEDIFSNGIVSSIIRYLVAPIPIKKQATDIQAVRNCISLAREGGTIAIAPEGNRTYSGKTEYINPAIAGLAKKLNLPIALFRIEGGYGIQPRWCDDIRRGKMRAYFSRIIEPSEYEELDSEQLNEIICSELNVNEAKVDGTFRHKNLAEYLERAVYVCPKCGLSVFESNRDTIECKKCGLKVRYFPTKELKGIDCEFPFRFINDWYEYQKEFVNNLDLKNYTDEPMYKDTANIQNVIVYKRKIPLYKNAKVLLFGDRVVLNEMTVPFEEIRAVSVLGRNKLNIYHGENIYQLKGGKRFNALKYVNIFYRYKNISRGDINGKFLGL